eukprot:s414_g12.t2
MALHFVFALVLLQLCKAAHPRFALVENAIETMWQRPDGAVKGVFFIAHGCKHQGPDVFTEVTETGAEFKECAQSKFGKCLGLPEEVNLRRYALSRGYVVMSVSGGSGVQSCWYGARDVPKVAKAVAHVRQEEKLGPEMPLFALGASSGGDFVGLLPGAESSSGLGKLACIVPEIMPVDSTVNTNVPTLFIHMPRDKRTAAGVQENIQDLKSRNVRVSEIRAEPQKVTEEFLTKCVDAKKAEQLVKAYQEGGIIDSDGFLTNDGRTRFWTATTEKVLGTEKDSLVPDESCMSELMNVAWAMHEFTSQFAKEVFDFCEGKDISYALIQESSDGWKTELGPIEVFEFGKANQPLAVAIHGMAKSKIHEWDPTAEELAKAGYHVLVPNFHSLQDLKPGTISTGAIKTILQNLMTQSKQQQISLLLGKSWGGGVASKIAADPLFKVKKLVLVAPAEMSKWPSDCQVALFWTEDDAVVPIKRADAHPELIEKLDFFHKEKTGGHQILDAYVPLIRDFAVKPVPRSVELIQTNARTDPQSFEPFKMFMILLIGVGLPGFMYYKRYVNEKRYEKRSPRGDVLGARE